MPVTIPYPGLGVGTVWLEVVVAPVATASGDWNAVETDGNWHAVRNTPIKTKAI
jgi:hypothetical protein